MPTNSICSTWSANSSATALGVFLGTTKPPIRVLLSLHGTCRDVRRSFTDSVLLQTPPVDSLITSSHKAPRLAASISAPTDAQAKLLRAINMNQLDMAAKELRRLQTSGLAVEPHAVEQLIEGALACSACASTCKAVMYLVLSAVFSPFCEHLLLFAIAALLKKQKFRCAIAVFNSSQQAGPLHFHYFTYQSLVVAAIKVGRLPSIAALTSQHNS